ncbi:hypothetical protein H6G80_04640 [Nostoc sp. FACHB-87]|uniref:hormogonium polysaccharide biosynthesis protein HpsA n=1 Tax=Nostocaceae TaxID=1162 RepID=UPI0016871B46|nr:MULTISPECIES: hormogonium polysaccharide biosynthesis protein HpsA [Nostocaceae]MBD2453360.1 hypothetical protein [Nostoc sp. FACHB-87]MBD2475484.1 hypothetical protein [Anabaena sp. FACHB-83]
MSLKRQLVKTIKIISKTLSKYSLFTLKKQINWLLRTLFLSRRRRDSVNAGFVLPTVAMVALVVVLLTTAILFRSFERAKNASNVRVNEVVLQAATPALERAKAKLNALFTDPTLPRAVPSDATLYKTLVTKLSNYTLGDETSVTLGYDIDGDKTIEAPTDGALESKEVLETAWKFPVDTDNDGKFDSFTLYGVYFRNPAYVGSDPERKRSPLEARTAPVLGKVCDASGSTSASLVGSSSWYKVITGELKKSFFIYAATVPITDISTFDTTIQSKYKAYKGNFGFSAIELQQDRKQLPLTNNAVVYEDDLEITPGPALNLNGRIFTNSNFFNRQATGSGTGSIKFYQVSSTESCYYDRENGKIIIGGNVATNTAIAENYDKIDSSTVDLFKENSTPTNTKLTVETNQSTNNLPNEVAYNSQAYAERIDFLVKAQFSRDKGNDPQVVKDNIYNRITKDPGLDTDKVRKEELEVYFRQRTRRVPFKEVPLGTSGLTKTGTTLYTSSEVLQGDNDSLRPLDAWVYPTDTNTQLTIDKSQLPATDPETVDQNPVTEVLIGDRILVGNNLPELRWNSTRQEFVGEDVTEEISGEKWKQKDGKTDSNKTRTRTTRVRQLADLGVTGRDGYWETSAASIRADAVDVVGGLRIITGAGVYSPAGSNLPAPPTATDNPNTTEKENNAPVVWPDTMPMVVPDPSDPTNPSKQTRGHLVMRATAVYHYNKDPYDPKTGDNYQKPIACVSSYYNPTNLTTATTDGYDPNDATKIDKSNNGFSYEVSKTSSADITRGLTTDANGLFSTSATAADVAKKTVGLAERLKYQANLVFPNGQFVNPLLRQALKKATSKPLSLSEQAAIDSTICALEIADGTLTRNATLVPNDAIKETAFLDARQIKSIDKLTPATGQYDLEMEQRQPLEIRATKIDLDILRKQAITDTWSDEYLLPNSGVIYATRDDAKADSSDSSANVSATDYKLDPNRRPNAIMLVNGADLSRKTDYRAEEKGLILTTDLPVYIQGEFNKHEHEEFTDYTLSSSDYWSNFYKRKSTNTNFACRPNDPRLPKCDKGEKWRPASVLADAVTLLSSNFKEGYRSDGDFDLRNNRTDTSDAATVKNNRLKSGFWDNNFVTSRNFTDTLYSSSNTAAGANSSYFNNFVTPIQRRVNFPEYVMEMCFKLDVAECSATDWYIGLDADTTKKSSDVVGQDVGKLIAGTTAKAAKIIDQGKSTEKDYTKFPRRVAFKRDSSGRLLDVDNNIINPTAITKPPVALGIVSGKVDASGSVPNATDNALWFTTVEKNQNANPPLLTRKYYNKETRLFYRFATGATSTDQPILEPILQINVPKATPSDEKDYGKITDLGTESERVKNTKWLPKATETTFNLVIAAGDTPIRVGNTTNPYYEINGGLHNFPRFLENWDDVKANILGSFIQFKRSIYATAPFQVFVRPSPSGNAVANSLFSERQNSYYHSDSAGIGLAPYYMPPLRNWGFDVGLLSQTPDLFAQRFVIPTTDPPDEYYREVSRDDPWVQALLCAVQDTTTKDGFGTGFEIQIESSKKKSTKYALPKNQRPSQCQN